MRYHSRAPTLLSLLFTLLHHTASSPIPDPVPALNCDPGQESCGIYCCATDQTCQSADHCVSKGAVNVNTVGTWQYFTSTWTETGLVTKTATYSTLITDAVTYTSGSWTPPEITTTINPSGRSNSGYITFISTAATFAPPGRPTESFNGGVIGGDISDSKILIPTVTGTNTYLVPAPTGSLGFGGVVGGGSGGGNLTGPQIGGIVGGVLGALFLIALILLCCCMRKGFKGFFGWLNGSRRHSTTISHEHEHEHGHIGHGAHHGSTHHHHVGGGGGGIGAGAGAGAGAGFFGGLLSRIPGRRVTTTESHTHEHHTLHGHHGSHHGGGVVHGGAGSHFQSGHHGGIIGGGTSQHHRPSGHGGAGFAALLGGAAAGFASMFSRKKQRVSEKYSSTSYSGSYSGDESGSTESSTESSSSSSSDSSTSSSSSST